MANMAQRSIRLSNFDWGIGIAMILMHLMALLAFFPQFFSWPALIATGAMVYISGALGVTLGYHRLLTHRSFHTYKAIEYFLALCGSLSLQGSPAQWVGTHRIHHRESDQELDPHSPRHGFTWAHMLWCVYYSASPKPNKDAAKDLLRQPFYRWLDRFHYVPAVILGVALYAIGGWPMMIWAMALRIVVLYHFTWFVNSAAHTWGYRNYNTTDGSRNTWWVAVISWGEGWHNNHHAYQRSAAHGLRWWEFDLTYLTILAMEKLGLAWKVVKPTPEMRKGESPSAPTTKLAMDLD